MGVFLLSDRGQLLASNPLTGRQHQWQGSQDLPLRQAREDKHHHIAKPQRHDNSHHVGGELGHQIVGGDQRHYARQESRYLEMMWGKVSLIHAVDETDQAPYGVYYSKTKPLVGAAFFLCEKFNKSIYVCATVKRI